MFVASTPSFCNLIRPRSSISPARSSTVGRHETPLACSRSQRVKRKILRERDRKRKKNIYIYREREREREGEVYIEQLINLKPSAKHLRDVQRRKIRQKSLEQKRNFFSFNKTMSRAFYLTTKFSS